MIQSQGCQVIKGREQEQERQNQGQKCFMDHMASGPAGQSGEKPIVEILHQESADASLPAELTDGKAVSFQ